MRYTGLGRSELNVSRICMGCMSFGSPGWLGWKWIIPESEAEPYFKKAAELGINFFDTAESYSDGESERIAGKWLKKYHKRKETVIATKRFFSNGESRADIKASCEASLKRLGVDEIDLYQIHRLMPGVSLEKAIDALDELVEEGKVRYIGISSVYAWKLMQGLSYSDRNGLARFVSVQDLYNLLYREEEREMQPLCEEEGLGMIPWSPLARGILARGSSDPGQTDRSSVDPFVKIINGPDTGRILSRLSDIAKKRGAKTSQIALAWMLSKKAVAAPIIGVTKISHLEDTAGALDLTLSEDEIYLLEELYIPKPHIGITPPFRTPLPGGLHDRLTESEDYKLKWS